MSDPLDAAALLARAFARQPLMSFLLGGPGREREIRLIFGALCRDAARFGVVEGVDGAAAVWLAPGSHPLSRRREVRMLPAWARLAAAHPRAIPRLLRAASVLEALHPAEPHWFLSLLGTEPALQGRGLGGALLERGLERARGMPVHLDTDTERNVAWYTRFGFAVTAEVQVMEGAPKSWAMLARP